MAYVSQRKENSRAQHQPDSFKAATQTFSDSRELTTATQSLQAMMANSPQQQKLKATAQMMANSPAQQRLNITAQTSVSKSKPLQQMEDEEPLQGKFESEPGQLEAAAEAPRPNNTGLPDNLKAGIENLSGMSMDHVKVHYNSDKPAQLQAHAYAQGSEIHVAPGQEQHLPHEAWHLVQQAQGRVKPTVQMKGEVPVNDDVGLETEADTMGRRALSASASIPLLERRLVMPMAGAALVQRAITQDTWNTKIEPNLATDVAAKLTGGTATMVKRIPDGGLRKKVDGAWVVLGDLGAFLAAHTWDSKLIHATAGDGGPNLNTLDFSTPGALTGNIPAGVGEVKMNVEEVAGDRHSFIHHSYSTYKTPGAGGGVRREAGHHLTVENAHLLAMLALQGDKTLGYTDKTTKTKPEVNTELAGHGVTEVDNLNFFPRANAQASRALGLSTAVLPSVRLPQIAADEGAEPVDEQLSMAAYLSFIQTSLASLPDVPAVYGAKILHSAQVMQTRTGLDPAALFLKVGKGDQRQLVRVVLTMAHKGLAEGLVLTPEILAIFKRYITNTPALPIDTPITEDTEWVAKGALAADGVTNYNALETRYVEANYAAIVAAMNAYVAAG